MPACEMPIHLASGRGKTCGEVLIGEVADHHFPRFRIVIDDQDMAYLAQVIIHAVVAFESTRGSRSGKKVAPTGRERNYRHDFSLGGDAGRAVTDADAIQRAKENGRA